MEVTSFIIENKSYADYYLRELLEKPEYRSMEEVNMRAEKYIKDAHLKNYFLNRATEILKTYNIE